MLAHRLQRWPNINSERVAFPGVVVPLKRQEIHDYITETGYLTLTGRTVRVQLFLMAVDPQHRYSNESERQFMMISK